MWGSSFGRLTICQRNHTWSSAVDPFVQYVGRLVMRLCTHTRRSETVYPLPQEEAEYLDRSESLSEYEDEEVDFVDAPHSIASSEDMAAIDGSDMEDEAIDIVIQNGDRSSDEGSTNLEPHGDSSQPGREQWSRSDSSAEFGSMIVLEEYGELE